MAKNYNPGKVNIEAATSSILSNGGGVHQRSNADGSTHITVFSRTENRHLSYDKGKDGKVSNVHTDRNNRGYMDYKSGK